SSSGNSHLLSSVSISSSHIRQQPPQPQHLQTHQQQSEWESEGQLEMPPEQQQQPIPLILLPPQPPLHAHLLEAVFVQRLQRLPHQIKRQRHMLTQERDMARKYWQLLQNIMDDMPDEMPLPPRREEPRSSREAQQVQQAMVKAVGLSGFCQHQY
ncbi:MAG: hypothetical protein ACKPKO_00360, partial [Candidatus Fonsibacter sp.]